MKIINETLITCNAKNKDDAKAILETIHECTPMNFGFELYTVELVLAIENEKTGNYYCIQVVYENINEVKAYKVIPISLDEYIDLELLLQNENYEGMSSKFKLHKFKQEEMNQLLTVNCN